MSIFESEILRQRYERFNTLISDSDDYIQHQDGTVMYIRMQLLDAPSIEQNFFQVS